MIRLTVILALSLASQIAGCGIDTSKLDDKQKQAEQDKTKDAPADQGQPVTTQAGTQVTVKVETKVSVSVGQGGSAAPALLKFADGAYGYFMADGSFAAGLGRTYHEGYADDQASLDYCRFAAPGCEGACILAKIPAYGSLFSNGTSFVVDGGNPTEHGRVVVNSVYRNGACEAETMTLKRHYRPAVSWQLDAGDSTVPSIHHSN